MAQPSHHWVFGYGSLIWRPDFAYAERQIATLPGFTRRFWQGSHDHRGLPDAPGRVVTLVPARGDHCLGMAYLVAADVAETVFEQLDHREKNGYDRVRTRLHLLEGEAVDGLVYIAPQDNFAFLGDAPLADIARQIAHSVGPSGKNSDYLFELAQALRELGSDNDEHIFALETQVRALLQND